MNWKTIGVLIIGISLGAVLTSQDLSTEKISVSDSNPRESVGQVSIEKLATNPSKYRGKQVTVVGEFQSEFDPIKLTDGAYSIGLYLCRDKYNLDLDYGDRLKVTGTVVNPPNNNDGFMIQCGKPPTLLN